MHETMEFGLRALYLGVGATLAMDLWALLLWHGFGVASLDYALVGRWLGHIPRGVWRHVAIARAPALRGERLLGWGAHYLTGVAFAALLLALTGQDWARQPTPWPALAMGWVSVAAPFLLLQPALGAGLAARRTPRPNQARLRSLAAHTAFGAGLYLAAWLGASLLPA